MTDKARIKIAAFVTALFLAGASTVGIATHQHSGGALSPAPAAVVQQPAAAPAPPLFRASDEHNDTSASEIGND